MPSLRAGFGAAIQEPRTAFALLDCRAASAARNGGMPLQTRPTGGWHGRAWAPAFMNALRLLRISLTVSDLAGSEAFYTKALGFGLLEPACDADPAMARLLGASSLRTVQLHRGSQVLELAAFDPPGSPYPPGSRSNDLWFQHCALAVDDMASAYARLTRYPFTPISRSGPQTLPGGANAFKFRDGDGHPLELIALAQPDPATVGGIDHSAISVSSAERSTAFYADTLGLHVTARQINTGPAQDALDGLDGVRLEVVALTPAQPAPHVELLGYRAPSGRPAPSTQPGDIAASRLVFQVDSLAGHPGAAVLSNGARAVMMHDPDGHALLLLDGDGLS